MDKKYEMLALLLEDAKAEQEKVERYDQLIIACCRLSFNGLKFITG